MGFSCFYLPDPHTVIIPVLLSRNHCFIECRLSPAPLSGVQIMHRIWLVVIFHKSLPVSRLDKEANLYQSLNHICTTTEFKTVELILVRDVLNLQQCNCRSSDFQHFDGNLSHYVSTLWCQNNICFAMPAIKLLIYPFVS